MLIEIKNTNGKKIINNQAVEEILAKISSTDKDYHMIKMICENINDYQDLVLELKKLKKETTPASIMVLIKIIGNFSLIDAYPVFEDVMID